MNTLIRAFENEQAESFTVNRAKTYNTTMNHIVDLFAMGGALRNRTEDDIKMMFSLSFAEDELLALKLLFYLRDIREGIGERRTFRICLQHLGNVHPEIIIKNFDNIVEFGRWDDLLILLDTRAEMATLNYIVEAIKKDLESDQISLLAKWLPSLNASSKKTKHYARKICKYTRFSPRGYRKYLSEQRAQLNIVETLLSEKRYDEIDYSKLPSRALFMYREAFAKHDFEKYNDFFHSVEKGEAKINTKNVLPYEIVHEYLLGKREPIQNLETTWKNLSDYTNDKNSLVVVDTSGSMLSGKNYSPMSVSLSLGIYFAERNKGAFNNHFMTFSAKPKLQKIKGNSLYEKVFNLQKADWGMNTNLELVFQNILDFGIKHNVPSNEMPETIFIVSDMEFDACVKSDDKNFEKIKQLYQDSGYDIPLLVFWNVNSMQNNVPVKENEKGVVLVSGLSPIIFKMVVEKDYSPLSFVLKTINKERYEKIKI